MKLHVIVLGVAFLLAGSVTDVHAAVHFHHESIVYLQVWQLGKCECHIAYVHSWQHADTLGNTAAYRAAMRTASVERKSCRRAAKQRAHEAFVQARKERIEARRKRAQSR